MIALCALVWYTVINNGMHHQMMEANTLSTANAQDDLRAYVTLGDKEGKWRQTVNKDTVKLFFHNAGRTPAHHLIVNFAVDQKGAPESSTTLDVAHIERIRMIGKPFVKNGGGTGVGGKELASGEVAGITVKKEGVDFTKDDWSMRGYFEYCDVFSHWHCDGCFYSPVMIPTGDLMSLDAMFCSPEHKLSRDMEQIVKAMTKVGLKRYEYLDRCEKGD